ncbi:MAG: prolipoprotein diacylglyceryl transferase [Bacteroidetes bacterium]|jgi:phosphatidylglycerol---prolipoprotein diacylglyceryl transferase|nr:prolipoprotein diacylglyceryl transferase [Bacteroidota bacterium]MBT6686258.1 prolipoprotein diacylglyceryl transferase [Bacteroidota bacterium]MBT7142648.1 prolipoprotein diacylglyceryl transferase [Bacteroidota bacterium]MBT7492766.1 prolipoprotein diacylglyceryl transferase [Bacteroidota bacterium]
MIINYIHWNPDPEILNIFGFSIRYYGILFVGGLISCIYILGWIFKREKIPSKNLEKLSIYGMVGIMVGARLGHCLFYEPSYYLSNPLEMILPITFFPDGGIKLIGYQGLASHGGALGLLIALYFYSQKTKHSMIDIIDLIAVVAALGCGFIRLANFMNSEIIGMPTAKPWGVIFERVDNISRHPAQLYEAISYFFIFAIMMILYKKMRDRLKNGFFFGLILVLTFTARFIIEFIKENQVGFEDGMTFNMGQLLSLPYIVVGIGFIIYRLWRTKSPA